MANDMARYGDTTQAGPPLPEDPSQGELAIVIWSHAGPRVERLQRGASVVIGRAEPADIVVDDVTLSRSHARLTALGEYVRVEDLDSKNGVLVDGVPTKLAEVLPGGQLLAGSVRLVITRVGRRPDRSERLATFDQLCERAGAEIARAQQYGRTVALALVATKSESEASEFVLELRQRLRPFDVVAMYDASRACVLLPELDETAARRLLAQDDASVVVSPDDGATVDALLRRALDGRRGPERAERDDGLVVGPGLRASFDLARRFAASDLPVMILGETGTGKEVLARSIHSWSRRNEGSLELVNCAALPASLLESALFGHERGAFTGAHRDKAGLFEQADGGTLFLDEIGELSLEAQASLLRVLEDASLVRVGGSRRIAVDVRVVAATNRKLPALVEAGGFRLDLWHRLNALVVELPALRDRPDDLPALAARFLARVGQRDGRTLSLSGEALQLLLDYAWPGNVRELQNVLERAALLADESEIAPSVLPERIARALPAAARTGASGAPLSQQLTQLEERLIVDALDRCRGNQAAAARELDMPRRTLVRRIAELGLRNRDRWPAEPE